jgi:hypothetical protein
MADFIVSKSYRVPIKLLKAGRMIDMDGINNFWKQCDQIGEKRGCYVFSIKASKGEQPFYIGKASSQPFRLECFTAHKRADHYNVILCSRKGTPYMRFVVQQKVKGEWSLLAIDELEEYLIAQAAARNPALSNRRRLPNQSWSIRGVAPKGQGKPSSHSKKFRTLMGIK